ncbi:MAG: TIGR04086 family membrane protein [Clostridia bacterium]|nr:TIGR04086 family membrane protein [Clostridia bacterium]
MRNERYYGDGIFTVAKAAGLALTISVLGAVIFAAILRICNLRGELVYPINQAIKGIALIVGTLVAVHGEKGWLKGGIAGLLFTSLSYLAFSALGGDFSLSWLIFAELILAFVIGGIGGMLAVNVKKS